MMSGEGVLQFNGFSRLATHADRDGLGHEITKATVHYTVGGRGITSLIVQGN
jgi:hypothetical protein